MSIGMRNVRGDVGSKFVIRNCRTPLSCRCKLSFVADRGDGGGPLRILREDLLRLYVWSVLRR